MSISIEQRCPTNQQSHKVRNTLLHLFIRNIHGLYFIKEITTKKQY